MAAFRLILLLPFVALAGCAQVRAPARLQTAQFDEVAQSAAAKVKRCYRAPRIASSAKQISTRLLVRYREDGGLAALPTLVSQAGVTPDNSVYAGKMAEAAGLAVVRCAPVRLPAEMYEKGWSVLELTFSPAARA